MHGSESDPALNDVERQKVDDALEAILATEKFEAAPQMSAFLRYVVEQAADGHQNRIKAFTVAVDALGKPDSFDPQNDPVVRVLAGRLRAALSAYNDENPHAALIIKMTPGSYVPTFVHRHTVEEQSDVIPQTAPPRGAPAPLEKNDTGNTTAIDVTAHTENVVTQDSVDQPDNETRSNVSDVLPGNVDSVERETRHRSPPTVGLLDKLAELLTRTPKLALAAALIAAVAIAFVQNKGGASREPNMQAATIAGNERGDNAMRSRPAAPTVFISAIDQGNVLENSLNAVVSGVISESEQIRVYRILDNERETNFWPEDYILTLTTLDLPDETRISLQLMEAATGRIVHSEAVALNERAFEQLTQEELTQIIDTARAIVFEDGPLVRDYSAKQTANQ